MSFLFFFSETAFHFVFCFRDIALFEKNHGKPGRVRPEACGRDDTALCSTSMFVGTDNSPQLSESMCTWNLFVLYFGAKQL